MRSLEVVLRTCDRADVHPERGPRFIGASKPELVRGCFKSLLDSIARARDLADIKLSVLDDGSGPETLSYIERGARESGTEFEIEPCREAGYNGSALRQFEKCKDSTADLVYCVEDDYLHFPEAVEQMLVMTERFEAMTGTSVAIRPDDDPFTYSSNSPHAMKYSLVFMGKDRHWRTLHCTHNTVFTRAGVFREYWELFASLAKFYKKLSINEDKSINMVWEMVPLFSPIPTLAVHVSQNNEPPFVDYRSLWERVSS